MKTYYLAIWYPIRDKNPDMGNLPGNCLHLDLKKKLGDKPPSLNYVTPVLMSFFKEHHLSTETPLRLYCVGPNQLLIGISYLLSKGRYTFEFEPKSTDSKKWGFIPDKDTEIQDHHSFIEPKPSSITLNRHKVCVSLMGKFNLPGEKEVWQGDKVLFTQCMTEDLGDENRLHITHRLKLPQNYHSLSSKKSCQQFKKEIKSILDELLERKAKEIHILSSIPAQGLLYLGQLLSAEPYRDMEFYLYNYMGSDYKLGDVISTKIFQKIMNKDSNHE